jgi:hypothetical protein
MLGTDDLTNKLHLHVASCANFEFCELQRCNVRELTTSRRTGTPFNLQRMGGQYLILTVAIDVPV